MKDEIYTLHQDDFPKALLEIPQPPDTLYVRGTLPDPSFIHLAIVGSRKHTTYGKEVCEKLIRGLEGKNVVIVSGLALGIDTIAHKTAMEVGLPVLCFPGSGLSDGALYPRANIKLARDLVAYGGGMVAEYPPDFKATLYSFPQRNRLMAGISKAVLIIEAQDRSGTLITARLATEYNRDVLAVPGSIFSSTSTGTNALLHRGATPIGSVNDLLEALGFEVDKKKEIEEELKNCSPEEKKILAMLTEPFSRDEIIRESGMKIQDANALLSIMEIKGLIKEEYGEIRKS